jgi:chromosome segregation protein
MQIKRLEIIGFKSFMEKVSLDFQEGITAILGPNGCGKSNIVDALRWAMGEQSAKNLRGRSMEDVIFGGSESRKPLGMAEVSMIFSNVAGPGSPALRDYTEIMVTRRLYRNGESEYLLNKTPCRLLDITELFMDTGVGTRAYSIIEQGKIGMILNAKPEDRRFLIEEAAGVTKYKSRKKSALRKIEATKQNLLRLGDIVAEVSRQMSSLKRQAQKAQRYRQYREELKGIESRFAQQRFHQLQGEAQEAARMESEQNRTLEGFSAQLERGELKLEEFRLLQADAEKEAALGQERVFHLAAEIQKVEGRIGFGGKELESLERQKEHLAAEVKEVSSRLAEAHREEETLRVNEAAIGSDLERKLRNLAEGETALEELTAVEEAASARLEETRNTLFALLTDLSRVDNFCQDARRRLQSVGERTSRNKREAVSLCEQLEEGRKRIGEKEVILLEYNEHQTALLKQQQAAWDKSQALHSQLEENESTLLVRREELNRCRSRLESLRELERNLEGYSGGVKSLLQEPLLRDRFLGMAADVMEVPARYELAVEAVLGDRLQALLVAHVADACEALTFLRQKGGRCTFLFPLTFPETPAAVPGGTPLAEMVTPRQGAVRTVQALLRGVYLVDSLEPFLSSGIPFGVTLVTTEGESLLHNGELNGGAKDDLDKGLLHKKREMKELAAGVDKFGCEVERLQQDRLNLQKKLQSAEEAFRETGTALHSMELKVADSEKDLVRLRQESERLAERVEVLSLEEDQLREERETLERQLADAIRSAEEKKEEKTRQEEAVKRLQEELQARRGMMEEIRERVTALKVAVASLREREEGSRRSLMRLEKLREELGGRLALLKGREQEAEEEKARLSKQRERARAELDILHHRREEEMSRFERLREKFEEGNQQSEEQEKVLKELRHRVAQAREALGSLQMKARELHMDAEHLRRTFLDRYRLDLAKENVVSEEPLDADSADRRLEELRQRIDAMGEVNLTAIDEYRKLEERSRFLTTQQEDLRQSLEGLQAAITKINRTTRKRFRETFDQVNAKFREVFPRLFRGGKAELRLTDEEDLLETGIEIVAQPPGKKLQSVNLLSGGEKALAAVALVFSIFLIKPSPFCVLDEVDAPLDDANIGRFNEIVREMSEISQFIIITHSKRTMEIADTLYGVTMEEPGISKLVSVRINEFQA